MLLTLGGLVLLVAGGEAMVRGASALALRLGLSTLTVGLTVVAFGTSAPELAVNVSAAISGNTALSFGNIFGSNMANIGLIVSCAAMLRPLQIQNIVVQREVPMMLLATLVATALALDKILDGEPARVSRADGVVLLLLFTVFVYYTLRDLLRQRSDGSDSGARADERGELSLAFAIGLTATGIVGLVLGGEITVNGAVGVARHLGVSEALIGLSLVAIGTSLPELVAAVMASLRGHVDLAVGNVVGSNIFNLLVVLGVTATIEPVAVPAGGLGDLAVLVGLSTLLWLTSMSQGNRIIRAEAALLGILYLGYLGVRLAGLGLGRRPAPGFLGDAFLRRRPAADRAAAEIVAASRAVFPTEVDQLQMYAAPALPWEHALEVALRLLDALAVRKPETRRQAMDVRVDGEGGHAERLGHDDARRLVSDAWQRFERRELGRHLPAVLGDEALRELTDVARLRRGEAAAADLREDPRNPELRHRRCVRADLEQRGGHEVHTFVRALGGEQDGHEELERVLMSQRDGLLRIEAVEDLGDALGLLGALHRAGLALADAGPPTTAGSYSRRNSYACIRTPRTYGPRGGSPAARRRLTRVGPMLYAASARSTSSRSATSSAR